MTERSSGLVGSWTKSGLVAALLVLVADQISKVLIIDIYGLADRGRVHVLPFFDLVYVLNQGVSYGLFTQNSQHGQWLLAGFAVVVSIALAVWVARAESRLLAVSLGLIMGGAIGNAIDRVRLGGVGDFVSLHAFGFYWYVFNVADVAIVAGVAGLLYDSFKTSRNAAKNSV